MTLTYKQQQERIDSAIDGLVDVLNSLNPSVQDQMAAEISQCIRNLSNWSDAQWDVRDQLRPIYTAVNAAGKRVRVTIPE